MSGLVHIYEGDGKGKTTAAIGLAIRCAGSGGKVLFSQFLKNGNSNELKILEKIENIIVYTKKSNFGFTFNMTDEEKIKAREFYTEYLKDIINQAVNNKVVLLVMDEVIDAYNLYMINREMLIEFLESRPENMEIVMTGRNPMEEMVKFADYYTYFKKVRHPYDNGIKARVGIEM